MIASREMSSPSKSVELPQGSTHVLKKTTKDNKKGKLRPKKNPINKLKRRGRKPKDTYDDKNASESANGEQIILHLPINTQTLSQDDFVEKELLKYRPEIMSPQPYEPDNLFRAPFQTDVSHPHEDSKSETTKDDDESSLNQSPPSPHDSGKFDKQVSTPTHKSKLDSIDDTATIQQQDKILKQVTSSHQKMNIQVRTIRERKKKMPMMKSFQEASNNRQIPYQTSIYCWWCCHPFDNIPFVLPIRYDKETFHVTGCFCSPECGAAYNQDTHHNDQLWESYSLLNLLYQRIHETIFYPIKLAPPRMSLSIFGGHLSIEEFRENCENYQQEYNIVMPPMISIIPYMEEIQTNLVQSKTSSFIPMDKDRVKKATDDLRLRRSKPLSGSKNTLESCMNLTYT